MCDDLVELKDIVWKKLWKMWNSLFLFSELVEMLYILWPHVYEKVISGLSLPEYK
jgi:hypothetical protein